MTTYLIPIAPKSKPRPRVVNGRAYHDDEYTTWQHQVREAIVERYGVPIPLAEPFEVAITLHLVSRGRCDLDNLAAGVLDACQPPGARGHQGDARFYPGVLWLDDSLLRRMRAAMQPSSDHQEWIEIDVAPVPEIVWPKRRKRRAA